MRLSPVVEIDITKAGRSGKGKEVETVEVVNYVISPVKMFLQSRN